MLRMNNLTFRCTKIDAGLVEIDPIEGAIASSDAATAVAPKSANYKHAAGREGCDIKWRNHLIYYGPGEPDGHHASLRTRVEIPTRGSKFNHLAIGQVGESISDQYPRS